MPLVEGCTNQDFAVFIVIGVGVEDCKAVAQRQRGRPAHPDPLLFFSVQ
jgi:hypothetical protein